MRQGQNLIEFVIVMPLLIVILFGIIEFALFWKTTQTVQEIALAAAAAAASKIVNEGDANNAAVLAARDVVQNRAGSLGISNLQPLTPNPVNGFGNAPFALYEATSQETRRDANGNMQPLIDLTVDYRSPYATYTNPATFTNNAAPVGGGIITQLTYRYNTILLGAQFTLPGGTVVTIIPREIDISSTKIQQYSNY